MAIPSYYQLIYPLLKVLYPQTLGLPTQTLYDAVADEAGISKRERQLLLPSRQQPIYQNRIGWAHDRLKRKGYSSSPSRGVWCLTPAGRAFFEAHKKGIDKKTLRSIWYIQKSAEDADATDPDDLEDTSQSPDERIELAIRELNDSLAAKLLERIEQAFPLFFERLVLNVLSAVGYGAERGNATHVGGSGDGGIDGVISLDRLGLEKIYIQAKRWKDKVVGRPDIQAFYGALAGRRASKGIFITTSTFSRDAEVFAEQVGIVLVPGRKLADLMIEFGVGVSAQRVLTLSRVDSDYFEEES